MMIYRDATKVKVNHKVRNFLILISSSCDALKSFKIEKLQMQSRQLNILSESSRQYIKEYCIDKHIIRISTTQSKN